MVFVILVLYFLFGGFGFSNDRRQRISFDIWGLGRGEVVVVFSVTEADRKQSHQSLDISSQRSTKIEI